MTETNPGEKQPGIKQPFPPTVRTREVAVQKLLHACRFFRRDEDSPPCPKSYRVSCFQLCNECSLLGNFGIFFLIFFGVVLPFGGRPGLWIQLRLGEMVGFIKRANE